MCDMFVNELFLYFVSFVLAYLFGDSIMKWLKALGLLQASLSKTPATGFPESSPIWETMAKDDVIVKGPASPWLSSIHKYTQRKPEADRNFVNGPGLNLFRSDLGQHTQLSHRCPQPSTHRFDIFTLLMILYEMKSRGLFIYTHRSELLILSLPTCQTV